MTPRRLTTLLIAPIAGVVLSLVVASPAAAVTVAEKTAVLNSWTQANQTSYNAWDAARRNQGAWAAYAFDWSTDYCSDSPDQPLGFDFRMPCWHHDFGYRNYKAVGAFPANKSHVDDMFYFDLKTKCATYNIFVRGSCYSLAWTYYQAVKAFGSLVPNKTAMDQAAAQKAAGEAALARRTAG